MILTFLIITIAALIMRIIKGKNTLNKIISKEGIKGSINVIIGKSRPGLFKNPFDKDPGQKYLNPEKRYLKFHNGRFLKGQIRTLFPFAACNSLRMTAIPVKNDLRIIRRS